MRSAISQEASQAKMVPSSLHCSKHSTFRPFGTAKHNGATKISPCLRVRSVRAQLQVVATLQGQQQPEGQASRRTILQTGVLAAVAGLVGSQPPAWAFTAPPPGYRLHLDKLDGYSFFYPETWAPVTTSGNDVFLRNPFNIEENAFVDISSPSSSRYQSVEDLGSPQEAAGKLLDRYLNQEFMSTRLGIRREGEIVAATSRQGADGRQYYDIQVRMASYASRNPYSTTQAEVMRQYGLEWDRQLLTTLGVANQRLYQLRLQTPSATYEANADQVSMILKSFKVVEVEA